MLAPVLTPWLEPLIALAAEIGSTVAFESIASGAGGYYGPEKKAIDLEVAHSPKRCVKTSRTSSRLRRPMPMTQSAPSTAPGRPPPGPALAGRVAAERAP